MKTPMNMQRDCNCQSGIHDRSMDKVSSRNKWQHSGRKVLFNLKHCRIVMRLLECFLSAAVKIIIKVTIIKIKSIFYDVKNYQLTGKSISYIKC